MASSNEAGQAESEGRAQRIALTTPKQRAAPAALGDMAGPHGRHVLEQPAFGAFPHAGVRLSYAIGGRIGHWDQNVG